MVVKCIGVKVRMRDHLAAELRDTLMCGNSTGYWIILLHVRYRIELYVDIMYLVLCLKLIAYVFKLNRWAYFIELCGNALLVIAPEIINSNFLLIQNENQKRKIYYSEEANCYEL